MRLSVMELGKFTVGHGSGQRSNARNKRRQIILQYARGKQWKSEA